MSPSHPHRPCVRFKAFPEYAGNDLFLSGESYAGVYIPMLAREILNDAGSAAQKALKGFAVGDACAGTEVLCGQRDGPWFDIQFLHGHGQVSDKLYAQILRVCGIEQLQYGVTDHQCKGLIEDMRTAVGGYYSYNLYRRPSTPSL